MIKKLLLLLILAGIAFGLVWNYGKIPTMTTEPSIPIKTTYTEDDSTITPNKALKLINGGVKFTGKITEIDNSCNFDGICKIKVDSKWVITNMGGDPTPEMEKARGARGKMIDEDGNVFGGLNKDFIGKNVEAYAMPVNENGQPIQKDNPILPEGEFATVMNPAQLSLYGNQDFYIRFLK